MSYRAIRFFAWRLNSILIDCILQSQKSYLAGLWAIDVSKNWRITFKFQDGNIHVVNYEDYH
jgi:plasmid maintenance system killer protein